MLRIYYDGGCPFCTNYVGMLRLRETGDVELVDLRENGEIRAELEAEGYNLDQGMVAENDGVRVGGSDAINLLATLTTPSNSFNRINRAVFSNATLARLLYPVLRAGRWFLLFLLGREMIGAAPDRSLARREVFTVFFALFSIFHFFNYAFEYKFFPPTWDMYAIFATAVFALFRPSSPRFLFLLMLASTISTVIQAPVNSNHTMVRSAALLGYWLSFFLAMARNEGATKIFERFAPAGCGALLVMYFFGIFHKINTDFLDPATSCAMVLWRLMPQPLSMLEGPVIESMAIYGTFVVEGVVAIALLTRRFRHVGIALGMSFHLLLSLSSYAMYISFTTLSLALHTLFLNETSARAVLDSKPMQAIRSRLEQPLYKVTVMALLIILASYAFRGSYTLVSLVAFPLVLPFCWVVLRHGGQKETQRCSWRTLSVGIITSVLFFINCSMPYAGLKTAQAINMFANLRLEAGVSNHLVFSNPHRPFGYLEDVVEVEGVDGAFVYYDVLSYLEKNPNRTLTIMRDGVTYPDQNAETLSRDIEETLHPRWFRKWFHFRLVTLEQPKTCTS